MDLKFSILVPLATARKTKLYGSHTEVCPRLSKTLTNTNIYIKKLQGRSGRQTKPKKYKTKIVSQNHRTLVKKDLHYILTAAQNPNKNEYNIKATRFKTVVHPKQIHNELVVDHKVIMALRQGTKTQMTNE